MIFVTHSSFLRVSLSTNSSLTSTSICLFFSIVFLTLTNFFSPFIYGELITPIFLITNLLRMSTIVSISSCSFIKSIAFNTKIAWPAPILFESII